MDRETVERVARTAHIKLTEDELERYSRDLSEILNYFELLDEAPGSEERMDTYERYVRGPRLS